ncbi:hypothetical protein DCO48_21535 [Pseudomonas sp. SDI]|uniref:hypothetical protein n=1 Tax=Pseudomonas sp. SDI TaxID=2170734 RepID=UPI000DE6C06C|nr:hypothetical protein DCO48_21535 [Pseudomonas sp. SDI]
MRTFALLLAALSLTGCISFTPQGPIGLPENVADNTIGHGAQIADVAVTAPNLKDDVRLNVSRQLTEQITRYVEHGEYFQKLVVFPTKLDEQDVVLKFTFSSLKGKRTPHPGYFPGALLTLTMWIWVNGPIYVDTYDLAGELVVEDRSGKRLAQVNDQIKLDKNIGLFDGEYVAVNLGTAELRQLVSQLLTRATQTPQVAAK